MQTPMSLLYATTYVLRVAFREMMSLVTNQNLYVWLYAMILSGLLLVLIVNLTAKRTVSYSSMRMRVRIRILCSKLNDTFRKALVSKAPIIDDTHFKSRCPNAHHESANAIFEILDKQILPQDAKQSIEKHLEDMFGQKLGVVTCIARMFVQLHPALHKQQYVTETIFVNGIPTQQSTPYTLIDRLRVASVKNCDGGCHQHCPFHSESLLVHLIAASFFATTSAIKSNKGDPYMVFITALFHDCAKPETNKKHKEHDKNPCPKHGRRMGLWEKDIVPLTETEIFVQLNKMKIEIEEKENEVKEKENGKYSLVDLARSYSIFRRWYMEMLEAEKALDIKRMTNLVSEGDKFNLLLTKEAIEEKMQYCMIGGPFPEWVKICLDPNSDDADDANSAAADDAKAVAEMNAAIEALAEAKVRYANFSYNYHPDEVEERAKRAQCKCARYPAHGLLGAMYLSIFAQSIINTMSSRMLPREKIEWFNAITRTVQLHMSLHRCDDQDVCKMVLSPESQKVKQLCLHMFVGDNLGKIAHKSFESEKSFLERFKSFWVNVNCLPKDVVSLQSLKPGQKIAITVCGPSGSGKTTYINRLTKMLSTKHHAIHISRDAFISEVMTGTNERLEGKKYSSMYKAYDACKKYKTGAITFDELVVELSQVQVLSKRFKSITAATVPDVQKEVNESFNKAIINALDNTLVGIIIIDTLMNMWQTEAEKLPSLCEHIQIDVPLLNLSSSVSTNNGLSEQDQLRLSGRNTLLKPANGDFVSKWFNPIAQKEDNTKYQAPPAILTTDSSGVLCEVGWNNSLQWLLKAIGPSPILRKNIDTNLMRMNGCEFMQRLTNKHNGDMLAVRNILFKVWDVNMTGVLPMGMDLKFSADKKTEFIQQLVKYAAILHQHHVLEKPITQEEFENNDKLFWNTVFSIVVVKYKDGYAGEKFWTNRFMLKYRGLTLFIHPITGKVIDLRYLMDRGAEIHSKETDGKVTGQDDGDINHGQYLNAIKHTLKKDLELKGFLTQKADGSLGTFTVYSGTALAIMRAYVETWGTDVAKEIASQSLVRTQNKFMVILATQGTKSITKDMVPFATTSIFGGIRDKHGKALVSHDEMRKNTPLQIWQEHGSKVLDRVFTVHEPAYAKHKDESITIMFEMVCANRRDAFGGREHEEFACQATEDQFLFLGLGYASLEECIPHCVLDIKGIFQQPAFWEIKNASQVNAMIRDLTKVMSKEMTEKEFIQLYPPKNPQEFIALHPEGFVLYAYVDETTTPIHTAYGLPGILTYSKVKTFIYYIAHKFKVKNINALVEFGRVSPGHFPLCDRLYDIYASEKLQTLLRPLHGEFRDMVNMETLAHGMAQYQTSRSMAQGRTQIRCLDCAKKPQQCIDCQEQDVLHKPCEKSCAKPHTNLLQAICEIYGPIPAQDHEVLCFEEVQGEAQIEETQIGEAQFEEAQFEEAQIGEAQIGEAQIGEAQIGEAQFEEAQIGEAQCGEAQCGEAQCDEVHQKKTKVSKKHPLELHDHLKMNVADYTKAFIHALLSHKKGDVTDTKAVELRQQVTMLFVDLLIVRWNHQFCTEIQTLAEITDLLRKSTDAPFNAKGRELFEERARLAIKERSILLQCILETMPWNEQEWEKVAECTDIAKLLKVSLITQMVTLQNTIPIEIPKK
jgi:GTPase SAR1 family protein